jgi:hypothetical protein
VTGRDLSEIVAADFDRDGSKDVAVANISTWAIQDLAGAGDGTFGMLRSHGLDSIPTKLAAADMTGDGRKDLVAETDGYALADAPGYLWIFRSHRDGTFTKQTARRLDGVGGRFAIGDLNADGRRDVASIVYASVPKVEIFLNH